jgi:hypothetical protein
MQLNAEFYTPVNGELIPTGQIASVAETPFDFRVPQKLGESLGKLSGSTTTQSSMIFIRPWKDHFKSHLRSDQDHLHKMDLRSDQDHIFLKSDLDLLNHDQSSFFDPKFLKSTKN